MAYFVLVHGAYHGGWCWEKVAPLLRRHAHEVAAPTLTGLGELKHLLSAKIDLSTHIADIVRFLTHHSLRQVVLVGHSYAGMVISGVAEIVPDRIGRLIYLDAMVPHDGQCVFDILPGTRLRAKDIAVSGHRVKIIIPPDPQAFGVTDPENIAWMNPRLTPMPWKCYAEPIKISNPLAVPIPKTYILCKEQAVGELRRSHERAFEAAKGACWQMKVITGPHDLMITHPGELARVLLECVIA
ncbi:MAG: alpha/beta hydrolase [Candidatus Aureabacteria bacterium]|nr:alpha/beta hydrolase [Candidatus Auribacterota bacterium]